MSNVVILVVEDEKLVARMYEKALTNQGFEVKVANTGVDGISLAKQHKPNLILMDIMMPGINGIQALESIKTDPETQAIPVVMLTNLSGKTDAELAISKGAQEYWVKKDVDPMEFGDRIRAILQQKSATTM